MSIIVAPGIACWRNRELLVIDLQDEGHIDEKGEVVIALVGQRVAVGSIFEVADHFRNQALQEILEI